MKQNNLLTRMLLLFALIVGSGSAWADDVVTTYTFSDRDWNANDDENAQWSGDRASGFTANQGVQIYGSTSISVTSPVSFTNVKKIVVTYCTNSKKGYGTIGVTVGSGTEQTFTVSRPSSGGNTLKTAEFTYDPTETGTITLSVDCSENSMYIYSIAITTEEEASTEPSITASNVELNSDDTSGEFSYVINNAVSGANLSASTSTSWISNVSVDAANSKVTFSTTANETAVDREGTITLTYMNGEEELATKNVTVTQGKTVVIYTYSLAKAVVPGRHYIITNGTDLAIGEDRGNNRLAQDITISEGTANVYSDAGIYEFLLGFDNESGYFTIYDETNNGYLCAGSSSSNHLKCNTSLDDNGKWTIEIDDNGIATIKSQGSYTRNWMRCNGTNNPPIFACYGSGQQDIYLYEKVGDTGTQDFTVSINSECTDGTNYYGTFSAPFAFTVPSDVTVAEIAVLDDELLVEEYEAGAVVPANTGVMISSATAGDKTFASAKGGSSVLGDDNNLRPTVWGVEAADMTAADANSLFYRLTMHNGTQIGFWWGAADGAAFDYDVANRAYLAVPEATTARVGFVFGEETTGIGTSLIDNGQLIDNTVYNLNGQRVAQPTKGLYIVGGRKVVVK